MFYLIDILNPKLGWEGAESQQKDKRQAANAGQQFPGLTDCHLFFSEFRESFGHKFEKKIVFNKCLHRLNCLLDIDTFMGTVGTIVLRRLQRLKT